MAIISVIIPVYNTEKYIKRCVNSVLKQTFQDFEIIAVDDGSKDNSLSILKDLAKQDKRIKVFHKKNGGVSQTRNFGIDKATGKYILFIDGDDFIHYQTLEISYNLAEKNNSDIVFWYKNKLFRPILFMFYKLGFNIDKYYPYQRKINKIKFYKTNKLIEHLTEYNKNVRWPIKRFYIWRNLIKKSFLQNIRFKEDLFLFEELPFWTEIALKHPNITITNLPLYYYFPNFNSLDLKTAKIKKIHNWLKSLNYALDLINNKQTLENDKYFWERNCKWPIISYRLKKYLDLIKEDKVLINLFKSLCDKGLLENTVNEREIKIKQKFEKILI